MSIILFQFGKVQFYVAFRTEVDGLGAINPHGDAVLLQIDGSIQQAPHDVDKLVFGEVGILQLLLLDGSFEREVEVAVEGMHSPMFDAKLDF